uniref:N-acetyltransferase domain-containing protein n=1 Tax=Panagrellus redivivus TaxID=6233 RepID=A0A7E4ZQD8_PANRE
MLRRLVSNFSTPMIQTASICAEAHYTPIKKQEKCPEGYLRHPDPLSREIVIKGYKSRTGRLIDFVKADFRDRDMAAQFFCEEYSAHNNCCRHANMTFEDFECMAAPGTDLMLDRGDVFMAFDGDKLVATHLVSYYYEDKLNDIFHGELPGDANPVFKVKDDYADVIKTYNFNPAMNRYMALLDTIQPQTGKFLPKGVKALGINEVLSVLPEYQKDGIGYTMLSLGDAECIKRGITHIAGYALAVGTQKICKELGYDSLYTLPYTDFKENGTPVYANLYDGAIVADSLVRAL